jgi:hypothetical protein
MKVCEEGDKIVPILQMRNFRIKKSSRIIELFNKPRPSDSAHCRNATGRLLDTGQGKIIKPSEHRLCEIRS